MASAKMNPLGTISEPEDIAAMIGFLSCNERARTVTGASFLIDSGISMTHAMSGLQ